MELLSEAILQYAERYTSAEDALLKEVSDFTKTHHPKAHMMSGHLQGKLLEMLSCMMRPGRILEVGTFTGYSALCLAKGLAPNGQLHTIELRREDAETAQGFFNRSLLKEKIFLHIGEAAQIIGELNESWDLVFIDADKKSYIQYFSLILPLVKQNGFIFVDNTLFHGQVVKPEVKGKNAKAVQAFNDFLQQRTDVQILLLPLRDGLTIARKL